MSTSFYVAVNIRRVGTSRRVLKLMPFLKKRPKRIRRVRAVRA